jgi:hypothetical protein
MIMKKETEKDIEKFLKTQLNKVIKIVKKK